MYINTFNLIDYNFIFIVLVFKSALAKTYTLVGRYVFFCYFISFLSHLNSFL